MSDNPILKNLDQPEVLECHYRSDPERFEADFQDAIQHKSDSETLRVWQARLSYLSPAVVQKISVAALVTLCLVAGFFTKLPAFLPVGDSWYYPRFMPLITIVAVVVYFLITATNKRMRSVVALGVAGCIAYLLVLPDADSSDSITMALIHLPLFAMSLLAASFMSDQWNSVEARLNFIRYIGEMLIYTSLILLGGMVLTAITLGLFNLIDLDIDEWYMEYVVVLCLVSAPVVATYLFDTLQRRQSRFAPMLSNVFSPLFLITILAYLVATFYQGRSPFTDRDFLILFNGLLLVILVLTIFSISGKKRASHIQLSDYINVLLVAATLVVNVIALSAILFRWLEFGLTVNRLVVTGANLTIFVHLILILVQYAKCLKQNRRLTSLEAIVARYLPVYTVWSLIVAVVLPLVFQFK